MAASSIKRANTIRMLFILIILFQSALHHAFPFHNSSVSDPEIPRLPKPKSRFTREYSDCNEEDEQLIEDTLAEARLMIQATSIRLGDLEDALKEEPDDSSGLADLERSALYTFESLFNTVYHGPGDERNADGLHRISYVKARVGRLLESFQSDLNTVEIHCNDDFYEDPNDPDFPSGISWDSRPAERGGQTMVNQATRCDDSDLGTVQAIARQRPVTRFESGSLSLMVICPNFLTVMRTAGEFPSRKIANIRDREFGDGETHIDTIMNGFPVGCLVHELSHLQALVLIVTRDVPDNEGAAYGWVAATYHGRTSQTNAVANADNFALFVIAMYLSKNDWSTGESRPIH